jgi:allantoicase
VIRLGLPGVLKGVDIDTSHFLGNHPPFASVDGCHSSTPLVATDDFSKLAWTELIPKSPLKPGSRNFYPVTATQGFTHLRLNIYPDGGVARFRAYGDVQPDFARLSPDDTIDLAAVENGGRVLSCNDMFFGPKDNLIMPGRGVNMGDGWETKRKRNLPGNDWVIVQLGALGKVRRVVVDTCHFKGNFPDRCSIEGINAPGAKAKDLETDAGWTTLLAETKLQGHHIHDFVGELQAKGPVTHVRLKIFPDGGVSRLRVFATLAKR